MIRSNYLKRKNNDQTLIYLNEFYTIFFEIRGTKLDFLWNGGADFSSTPTELINEVHPVPHFRRQGVHAESKKKN